jgi:ribose transport system permease protein
LTTNEAVSRTRVSRSFGERLSNLLRAKETGVLLALVLMSVALAGARPAFRTQRNLLNIGRQVSTVGIMAVGMTFMLASAEIDLSVGSTYAAAPCVAGLLMTKYDVNVWLSCVIGLLVGVGIGFVNGFFTTKGRLPSFITSLGTMSIVRGLALLLTEARPVTVGGGNLVGADADRFFFLGGGRLAERVPMQFVWFIGILIVGAVLLALTTYGFRVYAIGGNLRAAHLSGINVHRIKIVTFVLLGALCALSGLLTLSFLGTVTATIGQGIELDVISAAIIGGAPMSGGGGTVPGTLIGAVLMGVLRNGLVLLGISPFWQTVAIGAVIILAVGLDRWFVRREG